VLLKLVKKNLFSNITYCTLTTNHSVITFMETWKCQGILQRSGKRHKVKGQGICVVRDIWLWHLSNMLVTKLWCHRHTVTTITSAQNIM